MATIGAAILVAIWFARVARTQQRNRPLAAIIGALTFVVGTFFWRNFFWELIRPPAKEDPTLAFLLTIASSLPVGFAIAASIRFILYDREKMSFTDAFAAFTTASAMLLSLYMSSPPFRFLFPLW